MAGKRVEVDFVQGVGDGYWTWQKLHPHVDEIAVRVLVVEDSPLQNRAVPFLELLPKVTVLGTKLVSLDEYHAAAASFRSLENVLEHGGVYAVNAPLERGIRLDALDDGAEVTWDGMFNVPDDGQPPCAVLYVSGSKPKHLTTWGAEEWADLWCRINPVSQTVLLGAEYDRWQLVEVQQALRRRGVCADLHTTCTAAETIQLIRGCEVFVGYQSGLNVIADAYDRKQVMLYFEHLAPMMNTWCKPEHIGGLFKPFTFGQTVTEVANGYGGR